MSSIERLTDRVARLERELRLWRFVGMFLLLVVLASVLVRPAYAVEQFLTVMGLSADTVRASQVDTVRLNVSSGFSSGEATVRRLLLRDDKGKVRAVLDADRPAGSEV